MSDCTTARAWLSAFRDGEEALDPVWRAHIETCAACQAWERSLDELTRRVVVRSDVAPDTTQAAIAEFSQPRPRVAEQRIGRIVLAVAGVLGVALGVVALIDGVHVSRDLAAMETALAVGFLLAAWRPAKYGPALLPVTAVAGVLVVLASATPSALTSTLAEASHLPVLFGVAGMFVMLDSLRRGTA